MKLLFVFILSLLFMFASYAQQTITLYSTTSEQVTNGDMLQLLIESEVDSENLKKFEGQWIEDFLYVDSFVEAGSVRKFEVVVAPKQKKDKEKAELGKYSFNVKELNYVSSKQAQGFKTYNNIQEILEKKIDYLLISIIILILIMLYLGLRFIKSRKMKRLKIKQLSDFLYALKVEPSRKSIEVFYAKSPALNSGYSFDKSKLTSLRSRINSFQYDKDVDVEIIQKISLEINEFLQNVEVSYGV